MNFIDSFQAGQKAITSAQLADYHVNFDKSPMLDRLNLRGIGQSDSQEMGVYENGGAIWVSAAINRKKIDVANVDFYFKDTQTNKRIEIEKLPEEIAMPYKNGWAGSTFNNMASWSIAREDLCGNDIWVKSTMANQYTQEFRKIGEFIVVPSGSWTIFMAPDMKSIHYYIVHFGSEVEIVYPENVIHFRSNQIINPFIGIGLIAQARLTVESEIVSKEYENNFLVRDGAPSMVVLDKSQMNPDDAKAKATELRTKYREGVYKNGVMYLWGDVSVQGFQSSPKDIEFIKPMNREAIISIMQSCPTVLGLESQSGNRAIADKATQNYFGIVNSRINSFCNTVNMQHNWKVDQKRRYELTYTPYPTGDIEQIKIAVEAGITTMNEARQKIGQERIENSPAMDTIFVSSTRIPIDMAYEGAAIPEVPIVKKNYY